MIVDVRSLDPSEPVEADLCIIGAGAAGISLALEMAGSEARICMLEAGGTRYERSAQDLLRGETSGDAYPPLRDTRFSAFGGSTRLWAGWCRPLDDIDFEPRPWLSEGGWPFGREALLPHYRRAQELCGLGAFEYDPATWEARGAARRLPVEDADLTTILFQVNPIDFGVTYRSALQNQPNVRVLLHGVAMRLRTSDASEAVDVVEVATLDGRRLAVRSRLFVLAAGGIENARLLLLSGDDPARSVGNVHGLVGTYFTEHAFVKPGFFSSESPAPSLDLYFPTKLSELHEGDGEGSEGAALRAAFSLSRDAVERSGVLNSALHFLPAYEAHPAYSSREVKALLRAWEPLRGRGVPGHAVSDLMEAMRAPNRLALAVWRRLLGARGNRWPMRAFFECEPQVTNRVVLSDRRDVFGRPLPRIEWRLSDLDVRSIRHAWATLDRGLRTAGVGRLELAFPDVDEAWRASCVAGMHHMGTTRMHADAKRGVVDPDARVHGAANLYVAGSSVFPTVGFANPTLTIVALAVRLAQHLRSEL